MKTDMITSVKGIALDVPAESLLQMQARYNMLTAKRNKSFMERLQNVHKIVAAL